MSEVARQNGEAGGLEGNSPPPLTHPDAEPGGRGELQKHALSTMQTLRAAISQGWNIKPEWLQLLPGVLTAIALDPKSPRREKRQAVRTLAMMHASNIRQAEVLDKMNRLDDGQPTEQIVMQPITLRVVEKVG